MKVRKIKRRIHWWKLDTDLLNSYRRYCTGTVYIPRPMSWHWVRMYGYRHGRPVMWLP